MILVLPRVGSLVLEDFDELVEASCYDGTEDWSEPVDPVVAFEVASDDGGTEGAGWVERSAGEVDAGEFCDEE